MYMQEIDLGPTSAAVKSMTDQHLCELWVLAERMLMPSLQNACVREIEKQRLRFKATSTSVIPFVYERTADDSPLRRLFVSQCAFNVDKERFWEKPDHFPKQMLLDLVRALNGAVGQEGRRKGSLRRDIRDFEVREEEEDGEDVEDEEMGGS